jgi:toxin FitB
LYLLDTNVVSEFRHIANGRGEARVGEWATRQAQNLLFVSAITLFEIEMGILLMERRDARQGAALRGWLNGFLLPTFANQVLPVDDVVARACAALHVPNPAPIPDSFIAATALVHGFTVATRNTADFARSGVSVINPWLT